MQIKFELDPTRKVASIKSLRDGFKEAFGATASLSMCNEVVKALLQEVPDPQRYLTLVFATEVKVGDMMEYGGNATSQVRWVSYWPDTNEVTIKLDGLLYPIVLRLNEYVYVRRLRTQTDNGNEES